MKNILLLFLAGFISTIYSQTINLTKYANSEQTINSIRIASAAIVPDKWEKATNWERIEKAVREAAKEGGKKLEGVKKGLELPEKE